MLCLTTAMILCLCFHTCMLFLCSFVIFSADLVLFSLIFYCDFLKVDIPLILLVGS